MHGKSENFIALVLDFKHFRGALSGIKKVSSRNESQRIFRNGNKSLNHFPSSVINKRLLIYSSSSEKDE